MLLSAMSENVEIRNLKEGTLYNVTQILDTDNDWKRFMSLIPKDLQSENFVPKYNNEHIMLIEEHSRSSGEKCAKILFDEWGTSGQVRPTLRTVMNIGIKAGMIRVTDEIARLLGEAPPPRPQQGPGASVDTDISRILLDSELQRQTTAQIKTESNLIKFSNEIKSRSNDSTVQMKTEDSNESNNVIQDHSIAQMKSASNSFNGLPNIGSGSEMSDTDMPAWSKLMVSPNPRSTENSKVDTNYPVTPSAIAETVASGTTNSNYQRSLPNIEAFQSGDENLSFSSRIDKSILQDTNLIHFNYLELQNITSNFSETVMNGPHGLIGKIGKGGFGEVFVGSHPRLGPLAIKRTHAHVVMVHKPDVAIKLFNSEVKYLSQFRHENIVPIIGFSKDGPALCIVCEYIDGGSLEQKLAEKVLNEKQRINIMQGTAEGLQYLHSYEPDTKLSTSSSSSSEPSGQSVSKSNFVHRDVKSANILLTRDFRPKLCDFGLAKQYDTTFITSAPMGTSAYMAPEGLFGTITQKIDIYSYGIVMLELLTGLKCIVHLDNGDWVQIRQYIDDTINKFGKTITDLLDTSAGVWSKADDIFSLANRCLAKDRHNRPAVDEICKILHTINQN